MSPNIRRVLAAVLSLVYFTTQVALASAAETNMWEERRKATQMAALPAAPGLSLPGITNTLPLVTARSRPHVSTQFQSVLDAIPLTHGTIQDIYDAKTQNPPVVLIQDVHLNTEAQTNIAAILQQLIDQKQAGLVGVEGAFSAFDFTPFRKYPNKEITKAVIEDMLNQNLLAAPSYVGITSTAEPPAFIGVDDRKHYDANLEALYSARDNKEKVLKELRTQKSTLIESKKKVFSKELSDFDNLRDAYHKGDVGIGAYVKKLERMSTAHEHAISQFLEAYKMESSLDLKQVEHERQLTIERLTQKLNDREISLLVAQSMAFRMGRIGFGDYYQGLKDLCGQKGLDLRQTPHFDNYIRYVLLSDGIKAEALFNAIEKLEETILADLAKTDEEKKLAAESEQLTLTEKLVDFSLTPNEWKKYLSLRAERSNLLLSFENFYEEADVRSHKMLEKLLSTKHQALGTVLVLGGFHSPQVAELLRKEKISYAVVSPKLTKIDNTSGSAYLSVFAREKTPLDRLFAGEKLFVYPEHASIAFRQTATIADGVLETEHLKRPTTKSDGKDTYQFNPDPKATKDGLNIHDTTVTKEKPNPLSPMNIFSHLNPLTSGPIVETLGLWAAVALLGPSVWPLLGIAVVFALIHEDVRTKIKQEGWLSAIFSWEFGQRFIGGFVLAGLIMIFPGFYGIAASWAVHVGWNWLATKVKWLKLLKITSDQPSPPPSSSGNSMIDAQIGPRTLPKFREVFELNGAKRLVNALAVENDDHSDGVKLAVRMKALQLSQNANLSPAAILEELYSYLDRLSAAEKRYGLFDTVGTEYEVMKLFTWEHERMQAAKEIWESILRGQLGRDEHIEYAIPPSHSWLVQEEIRKMMRPLGFIPDNHPWASRHVNVLFKNHHLQLKGFKIIARLIIFTEAVLNVSQGRIDYFARMRWLMIDPGKNNRTGQNNITPVKGKGAGHVVRDQTGETSRMEYRLVDDQGASTLQLIHIVHGLTQQAIRTAWKFKVAEKEGLSLEDIGATQLELRMAQILNEFVMAIESLKEENPIVAQALEDDWVSNMNGSIHTALNQLKGSPAQKEVREALRQAVENLLRRVETEILDQANELRTQFSDPHEVKEIPVIQSLMDEMTEKQLQNLSNDYIRDYMRITVPSFESIRSFQIPREFTLNENIIRNIDTIRYIPTPTRPRIEDFPPIDFRPFRFESLREIIFPQIDFARLIFFLTSAFPNRKAWGLTGLMIGTLTNILTGVLFWVAWLEISTALQLTFFGWMLGAIGIAAAQYYGYFWRRIRDGDFRAQTATTDLEARVRNAFLGSEQDDSLGIILVDEMTEMGVTDFETNVLPTLSLPRNERDAALQSFINDGFFVHNTPGKRGRTLMFVNSEAESFAGRPVGQNVRNQRFVNVSLYSALVNRLYVLRTAAQSPSFHLGLVLSHERGKKAFHRSFFSRVSNSLKPFGAELFGKFSELSYLVRFFLLWLNPIHLFFASGFSTTIFIWIYQAMVARFNWGRISLPINGVNVSFTADGRIEFAMSLRALGRLFGQEAPTIHALFRNISGARHNNDETLRQTLIGQLNTQLNQYRLSVVATNDRERLTGNVDWVSLLGLQRGSNDALWMLKKINQFKRGNLLTRLWRVEQIRNRFVGSPVVAWFKNPTVGGPVWEMVFQVPALIAAASGADLQVVVGIAGVSNATFARLHRNTSPGQKLFLFGVGSTLSALTLLPIVTTGVSLFSTTLGLALNSFAHRKYNETILNLRKSSTGWIKKLGDWLPLATILEDMGMYNMPAEAHPDWSEDTAFYDELENGAIIAGNLDGVGGDARGQKASQYASEAIRTVLWTLSGEETDQEIIEHLVEALQTAEARVKAKLAVHGSGTTVSVVVAIPKADGSHRVFAINGGDSRVYLQSNGFITMATVDNVSPEPGKDRLVMSLEEVKRRIQRQERLAEIEKADDMGSGTVMEFKMRRYVDNIVSAKQKNVYKPVITVFDAPAGSRLILTSDGIHDNLTTEEMRKIAVEAGSPQEAAEQLVLKSRARAYDKGHIRHKDDDITAVVVALTNKKATAPIVRPVFESDVVAPPEEPYAPEKSSQPLGVETQAEYNRVMDKIAPKIGKKRDMSKLREKPLADLEEAARVVEDIILTIRTGFENPAFHVDVLEERLAHIRSAIIMKKASTAVRRLSSDKHDYEMSLEAAKQMISGPNVSFYDFPQTDPEHTIAAIYRLSRVQALDWLERGVIVGVDHPNGGRQFCLSKKFHTFFSRTRLLWPDDALAIAQEHHKNHAVVFVHTSIPKNEFDTISAKQLPLHQVLAGIHSGQIAAVRAGSGRYLVKLDEVGFSKAAYVSPQDPNETIRVTATDDEYWVLLPFTRAQLIAAVKQGIVETLEKTFKVSAKFEEWLGKAKLLAPFNAHKMAEESARNLDGQVVVYYEFYDQDVKKRVQFKSESLEAVKQKIDEMKIVAVDVNGHRHLIYVDSYVNPSSASGGLLYGLWKIFFSGRMTWEEYQQRAWWIEGGIFTTLSLGLAVTLDSLQYGTLIAWSVFAAAHVVDWLIYRKNAKNILVASAIAAITALPSLLPFFFSFSSTESQILLGVLYVAFAFLGFASHQKINESLRDVDTQPVVSTESDPIYEATPDYLSFNGWRVPRYSQPFPPSTQGWKMHIILQEEDAAQVISAVTPILKRFRVNHKIANGMERLRDMNQGDDSQVGKGMAIYFSEENALALAEELNLRPVADELEMNLYELSTIVFNLMLDGALKKNGIGRARRLSWDKSGIGTDKEFGGSKSTGRIGYRYGAYNDWNIRLPNGNIVPDERDRYKHEEIRGSLTTSHLLPITRAMRQRFAQDPELSALLTSLETAVSPAPLRRQAGDFIAQWVHLSRHPQYENYRRLVSTLGTKERAGSRQIVRAVLFFTNSWETRITTNHELEDLFIKLNYTIKQTTQYINEPNLKRFISGQGIDEILSGLTLIQKLTRSEKHRAAFFNGLRKSPIQLRNNPLTRSPTASIIRTRNPWVVLLLAPIWETYAFQKWGIDGLPEILMYSGMDPILAAVLGVAFATIGFAFAHTIVAWMVRADEEPGSFRVRLRWSYLFTTLTLIHPALAITAHSAYNAYMLITGQGPMMSILGARNQQRTTIAIAALVSLLLWNMKWEIFIPLSWEQYGIVLWNVVRIFSSAVFLSFPLTVLINGLANLFLPARTLRENSLYYSHSPRTMPADALWPWVTVQIPVYTENFTDVIKPTILKALAAAATYTESTKGLGQANVVVYDDGLLVLVKRILGSNEGSVQEQLKSASDLIAHKRQNNIALSVEEKDLDDRLIFYASHPVGFVARPATPRRGRFPKSSNLNFGMELADRVELDLTNAEERRYNQREARLSALEKMISGEGSRGPPYFADGDIGTGELLVLLDKDSEIPKDVIVPTVAEFVTEPRLGFTQHKTRVTNSHENYFSQMISRFTRDIFQFIFTISTSGGDPAPLVGHNAFLRKSAMKEHRLRELDGALKYWSEDRVSEDFELSLRMQANGFIGRYVAYEGLDFGEAVTRTYDEEVARLRKFAYGASDLVFNPISQWTSKGILTDNFYKYLKSPTVPWYSKLNLMAYLSSYFSISFAFISFPMEIVLVWMGLPFELGGGSAGWVIAFNVIIFGLIGPVAYSLLQLRLQPTENKQGFVQSVGNMLKGAWMSILVFAFFIGVPFWVFRGVLAHAFNLKLNFGVTNVDKLKDKSLGQLIREVWKVNKLQFMISSIFLTGAISGAVFWRPDLFWHVWIGGLVLGFGHLIGPWIFNPLIVGKIVKDKVTASLIPSRNPWIVLSAAFWETLAFHNGENSWVVQGMSWLTGMDLSGNIALILFVGTFLFAFAHTIIAWLVNIKEEPGTFSKRLNWSLVFTFLSMIHPSLTVVAHFTYNAYMLITGQGPMMSIFGSQQRPPFKVIREKLKNFGRLNFPNVDHFDLTEVHWPYTADTINGVGIVVEVDWGTMVLADVLPSRNIVLYSAGHAECMSCQIRGYRRDPETGERRLVMGHAHIHGLHPEEAALYEGMGFKEFLMALDIISGELEDASIYLDARTETERVDIPSNQVLRAEAEKRGIRIIGISERDKSQKSNAINTRDYAALEYYSDEAGPYILQPLHDWKESTPQIRILGGADDSGPGASSFLFSYGGKNILLDVGAGSIERIIKSGIKVDAVFVSHAHRDHVGDVLRLHDLDKVPVYSLDGTRSWAEIMLKDSISFVNSREERARLRQQLKELPDHWAVLAPEQWYSISDEIKILFLPTSHITGASFIYVATPQGTFLYTGDFSQEPLRGSSPFRLLPHFPVDQLWEESTHGDRVRGASREEREADFVRDLSGLLEEDARVLLPVFALGRSVDVALTIREHLPNAKIYVDGMAGSMIENFVHQIETIPSEKRTAEEERMLELLTSIDEDSPLQYVTDKVRTQILNGEIKGPYCVLSGGGSLQGGRALEYFEVLGTQPNTAIILTGHQFRNTFGEKLKQGQRQFSIDGRKFVIIATVLEHSFSAHGYADDTTDVAKRVNAKETRLIHGEITGKKALKARLEAEGVKNVSIPKTGDVVAFNADRTDLFQTLEAAALPQPILRPRREMPEKLPAEETAPIVTVSDFYFGEWQALLKLERSDENDAVLWRYVRAQQQSNGNGSLQHLFEKINDEIRAALQTQDEAAVWVHIQEQASKPTLKEINRQRRIAANEERQRQKNPEVLNYFAQKILSAFSEDGPSEEEVQRTLAPLAEKGSPLINGGGALQVSRVAEYFQQWLGGKLKATAEDWRRAWEGLKSNGPKTLAKGIVVKEFSVNRSDVQYSGEAFFIDPTQFNFSHHIDHTFLSRDLTLNPLREADTAAGYTLQETVERNPQEIVFAVPAIQSDFMQGDSLAIVDGQVVTRKKGTRAFFQPADQEPQPVHGRFWVLSLETGKPGVVPIELDNQGQLISELPIKNGIGGPLVIKDGKNVLKGEVPGEVLRFNQRPSLSGNDLNWENAEQPMSMMGWGYTRAGELVVVQLIGVATDKDPRLQDLIEAMLNAGVFNGILGPSSGGVNRYSKYSDQQYRWAPGRPGSQIQKLLGNPRKIIHTIVAQESKSDPTNIPQRIEDIVDRADETFLEKYIRPLDKERGVYMAPLDLIEAMIETFGRPETRNIELGVVGTPEERKRYGKFYSALEKAAEKDPAGKTAQLFNELFVGNNKNLTRRQQAINDFLTRFEGFVLLPEEQVLSSTDEAIVSLMMAAWVTYLNQKSDMENQILQLLSPALTYQFPQVDKILEETVRSKTSLSPDQQGNVWMPLIFVNLLSDNDLGLLKRALDAMRHQKIRLVPLKTLIESLPVSDDAIDLIKHSQAHPDATAMGLVLQLLFEGIEDKESVLKSVMRNFNEMEKALFDQYGTHFDEKDERQKFVGAFANARLDINRNLHQLDIPNPSGPTLSIIPSKNPWVVLLLAPIWETLVFHNGSMPIGWALIIGTLVFSFAHTIVAWLVNAKEEPGSFRTRLLWSVFFTGLMFIHPMLAAVLHSARNAYVLITGKGPLMSILGTVESKNIQMMVYENGNLRLQAPVMAETLAPLFNQSTPDLASNLEEIRLASGAEKQKLVDQLNKRIKRSGVKQLDVRLEDGHRKVSGQITAERLAQLFDLNPNQPRRGWITTWIKEIRSADRERKLQLIKFFREQLPANWVTDSAVTGPEGQFPIRPEDLDQPRQIITPDGSMVFEWIPSNAKVRSPEGTVKTLSFLYWFLKTRKSIIQPGLKDVNPEWSLGDLNLVRIKFSQHGQFKDVYNIGFFSPDGRMATFQFELAFKDAQFDSAIRPEEIENNRSMKGTGLVPEFVMAGVYYEVAMGDRIIRLEQADFEKHSEKIPASAKIRRLSFMIEEFIDGPTAKELIAQEKLTSTHRQNISSNLIQLLLNLEDGAPVDAHPGNIMFRGDDAVNVDLGDVYTKNPYRILSILLNHYGSFSKPFRDESNYPLYDGIFSVLGVKKGTEFLNNSLQGFRYELTDQIEPQLSVIRSDLGKLNIEIGELEKELPTLDLGNAIPSEKIALKRKIIRTKEKLEALRNKKKNTITLLTEYELIRNSRSKVIPDILSYLARFEENGLPTVSIIPSKNPWVVLLLAPIWETLVFHNGSMPIGWALIIGTLVFSFAHTIVAWLVNAKEEPGSFRTRLLWSVFFTGLMFIHPMLAAVLHSARNAYVLITGKGPLMSIVRLDNAMYFRGGRKGQAVNRIAEEETIGRGVYLTDEQSARGYAQRRGGAQGEIKAGLVSGNFLDMRQGGRLPPTLEEKWRKILMDYATNPKHPWNIQGIAQRALTELGKGTFNREAAHGFDREFSEFLSSEGYDGLITWEGGEGNDVGEHVSVVVFDPKNVRPVETKSDHAIRELAEKLVNLALAANQQSNSRDAAAVINILLNTSEQTLFNASVKDPYLDQTQFFTELEKAVEERVKDRQLSLDQVSDILQELALMGLPQQSLNKMVDSVLETVKQVVIVANPGDKKIDTVKNLVGNKRPVIVVAPQEMLDQAGRLVLSRLNQHLKEKQSALGLEDTFLLMPDGMKYKADVPEEILKALVIATLSDILEGQVLTGTTLHNIDKIARMIARQA